MDGNVKQVIVIRRDLHMRRGKEIAQGAHASGAWLTGRLRVDDHWVFPVSLSMAEIQWMKTGFRKICVVVSSEEELLEIVRKARYDAGLVVELIRDAGHTEFHGEPTYTACAIGPDYDDRIDPVTGDLTLY